LVFLPRLGQQLSPAVAVLSGSCLDFWKSAEDCVTHAPNIIVAKYEFEADTVAIS